MKWSVRLGHFAGIDVYVHASFLLLLAWFGFVYWNATGTVAGVVTGLSLIVLLFACVLLHEYGHALTARRFGIRTRHITLLPIGGVAMLEAMPRDPRKEILVALAGPAVNLVIAAGIFLLLAVAGRPGSVLGVGLGQGSLLPSLLAANLMLAIFNLLPAFPMDGGRVLRALLSMRMNRVRATRAAARVGQVLAVGLGLLGFFGNPLLLLIAVFVWIGAGAEATQVATEERLDRRPAGAAILTDFRVMAPEDPLSQAIDLTLAGTQKTFPVLAGNRIVGALGQDAILRGLRDLGADGTVGDVMAPPVIAEVGASLATLVDKLRLSETRMICITRDGRLAGIIDLDNSPESPRVGAAPGR